MRLLARPLVLAWRYWPQLAACYLAGLVVRRGSIELAAYVGHDNVLWAALIMPVAGMARLGSYIAMFYVLRPGIPELAGLPRRPLRDLDLFATVVVPFFAIYLAWQLFKEDWLAYQMAAAEYTLSAAPPPTELDADALPGGPAVIIVIAGAFALRFLLKRFADRLPAWVAPLRIYVDSVWVFLTLSFSVARGVYVLVNPGQWLAQRRAVVWFDGVKAQAFAAFDPLRHAWSAVTWAVHTAFGAGAVPLMWLAAAGIVYGVSLNVGWRDTARRFAGDRATAAVEARGRRVQPVERRWGIVPRSLREKIVTRATEPIGRYRPVVTAARLIMHGGPLTLALYVLAYVGLAWLDMSGSMYRTQFGSGYLFRGMAWLIGPHDFRFWLAAMEPLELVCHLLVEPVRLCVIVTAFAYCLKHALRSQRLRSEGDPEQDVLAARVGQVDAGGYDVLGQQEGQLQRPGPSTVVGGPVGGFGGESAGPLRFPPQFPIGDDADAEFEAWRPGPDDGHHG